MVITCLLLEIIIIIADLEMIGIIYIIYGSALTFN
jgi:hypothetical protein